MSPFGLSIFVPFLLTSESGPDSCVGFTSKRYLHAAEMIGLLFKILLTRVCPADGSKLAASWTCAPMEFISCAALYVWQPNLHHLREMQCLCLRRVDPMCDRCHHVWSKLLMGWQHVFGSVKIRCHSSCLSIKHYEYDLFTLQSV